MTKKETLEIKRYKPEQIRDGIFSLRTRRLGTVAESLIKILANASWGEDISHDLFEPKEMKRIEVKFSCALRAHKNKIKENNILEEIAKASGINRMFSSKDWKDNKFDCNIQQVKRKKFDTLYYGIFFSDKVQIFKIKSTII